jgi:hypothetical protein
MDLKTFIGKTRQMIAAARAGDNWAAFALATECLRAIGSELAMQKSAKPVQAAAISHSESQSEDELLCECEQELDAHSKAKVPAVSAVPAGLFDALLPILMALLKKFLGA